MRLLITLLIAYPAQSAVLVTALLLAAICEGLSISALLPVLNVVMGSEGDEPSALAVRVTGALTSIGIPTSLGVLLIVIVTGIVIKNLLLLHANRKVGYIAAEMSTGIRLELLRAVMRSKWQYFVHQSVGRLANAMATEAMRASDAFINGVQVMTRVIQVVVYSIVAFMVSWQATLFCLLASGLIVLASDGLVRMSKRAGKSQTHLYNSLLTRLTDTLQSVKPFKAMGRNEVAGSVMEVETNALNRALQKTVLGTAALSSAQEPMYVIFIALGVYLALERFSMDAATVTMLVLVMARLATDIGKIQKQYQKMVIFESAYWAVRGRISEAEAAAEDLRPGKRVDFSQAIELQDVEFAYEGRTVFDRLSMHIAQGTMTTLIGPSGSGKTTVIDLIVGLVRPDKGTVLIDGQALAGIDLPAWRRQIGYVPQENLLLHDTIYNNVTLGEADLGPEDVARALRAAGAEEFVAAMPDGVDSMAGERGTRLSGGQRQRIMLARALAHRPRLLILDEATSALDPASEAAICRTLAALKGELTILAVTHQPALAEVSDRVYRLVDGWAEEQDAEGARLAES